MRSSTGKRWVVSRYKGERMYDNRLAQKLLAQMQGDEENGCLRLEKFTRQEWSEPVDYLWKWLDARKNSLAPATVKDYANSIKNYLEPFFKRRRIYIHEIGFDTIQELASWIERFARESGMSLVVFMLASHMLGAQGVYRRSRRFPRDQIPNTADQMVARSPANGDYQGHS